jgi:hypothetical protein
MEKLSFRKTSQDVRGLCRDGNVTIREMMHSRGVASVTLPVVFEAVLAGCPFSILNGIVELA